MSILTLTNYNSAYEGSYINSLYSLDSEIKASGGTAVYVFPQSAEKCDWIQTFKSLGATYFYPESILKTALLLRKIIRRHSVKIIHSHFAVLRIYLPVFLARIGKRKSTVHISHVHCCPRRDNGKLKDFAKKQLMNSDVVMCVGENVSDDMERAGFKNCLAVPNAVNFDALDNYTLFPRESFRQSPEQKLLFVFGYNFEVKGVDLILKALRDYDSEHCFTLLICAASHIDDGRKRIEEIFGCVPEFVTLTGPTNQVGAYYNAADIMLAPSRTEGFSYAVVEAAYMGLPVVLSDIPAHIERKIPGSFFFKSGDAYALWQAVEKAAVESNIEKQNAAKEYVQNEYSLKAWSEKIVRVYQSFCTDGKKD